jgi:pyridoxal phosphate enzyme (YggS family)
VAPALIDRAAVARAAAGVRGRIVAAGGDLSAITVVAVTKGFDAHTAAAVRDAGFEDLGENYAQELAAKAVSLGGTSVRWHFIGRVQRNKVASIAAHVWLWHGVDRGLAAAEIARCRPGARVLVQVNATGEPQKAGCSPSEAQGLVDEARGLGLEVSGLMAMGPAGPPDAARPAFRAVRRLADELGLTDCSMGMSDDLEVAVQEGATIVRVGRALLGPRPNAPEVRR